MYLLSLWCVNCKCFSMNLQKQHGNTSTEMMTLKVNSILALMYYSLVGFGLTVSCYSQSCLSLQWALFFVWHMCCVQQSCDQFPNGLKVLISSEKSSFYFLEIVLSDTSWCLMTLNLPILKEDNNASFFLFLPSLWGAEVFLRGFSRKQLYRWWQLILILDIYYLLTIRH